ncbi:iron-sulfur protein [Aliidongia dinghuensis]|uniref:Iron-sulfur protein n=1 Tax=Aliidongia dinghuensis TaxID=1867774 RepID=A0A8J2YW41_9PROT|nr:PDR/VanB family oxidoreductase [Aliidongia dinghuensis]GGF30235.1 iron-sulfur protein [Aliidongia dinghuensis]
MEEELGGRVRHTLRVARAEPVADGIHLFELRAPDGGPLPAFTPGAHLNVRVPNGHFRNYSICNDANERDRYVIAVKRESGGRGGSISLIDKMRPGDLIDAGEPDNLFELDLTAPSYLFVAGGIGITPILSMIRFLIATTDKPFELYYLTRSAEGTAFLAEARAMAGPGRTITIHHDNGDPANAFDLWPAFEEPSKAHIYCCGPRPLMDAVRDMTGHWPMHAVHFEDFGSDLVRPRADDEPFTVELAQSGRSFEVPVGSTILEILREHGVDAPSSCESGTCGTCRTALVGGDVDHRDLVLEDHERGSAIMICISRGRGTIEIDR